MSFNIESFKASLVKIKSKYTGSGVWLNLGFTEHSYVLTAEHNIAGEDLEVFDHNEVKLDSTYLCSLGDMDIAIIKIEGQCNNQVELCLDDLATTGLETTCLINGYPRSLVTTSEFDYIDHQGRISFDEINIFFQVTDPLPDDVSYIKGFSGGPIFEIINGVTYLKGIITDTFDENFSYRRIYGNRSSAIYAELPDVVKDELICKKSIENIVTQSCDKLDGKVGEYILESNLFKQLDSINLDELKDCEYFYLPDDKPKATQHLSLLRNQTTVEAYVHSRILSLMMDEDLLDISANPSSFESQKFFTIHVTNFTEADQLVAKLIRQENSMDYSNAIIMVIYSNTNNDLKCYKKKRISRIISDYAEGTVPELYNKNESIRDRGKTKSFLDIRKSAGLKFAVINIQFLIDMIILHIQNELHGDEYNKDIVKQEVIKVIRSYE
jgi:hypothetical protein